MQQGVLAGDIFLKICLQASICTLPMNIFFPNRVRHRGNVVPMVPFSFVILVNNRLLNKSTFFFVPAKSYTIE